MKIKFEINGGALIALALLSMGFATAEYTSDLNTKTLSVEAESTPIGTVAIWTKASVPEGWLELNGQSTAGYPDLVSLIGSNVPDFRGEHIRGWDNGRGLDSGRTLLSTQADSVKSHNHDIAYGSYGITMARQNVNAAGSNGVYSHYRYGNGSTYSSSSDSDTAKAIGQYMGNPMSSENRVRNISVMFIIKAEK